MHMNKTMMMMMMVVVFAVAAVSAQNAQQEGMEEWLVRWLQNQDKGVIKRSAQPKTVLQLLGVNSVRTVSGRSKRSVGDVSEQTTAQPTAAPAVQQPTVDAVKLLRRWGLMCPALGVDNKLGLTQQAVIKAFQMADKNTNGKIDSLEVDLFENIIEAFEICNMLKN